MATAWQTLEEAALTLGISSRTLHRRLAKGEFQTRLENGRREVLVSIQEPQIAVQTASASAADMSDAAPAPHEVMGQGGTELSADVQSTMLMLHEDRLRRTDLAIMAYQQSVNVSAATARRAVVNSRVAWGTAGGLAAIMVIGIAWATHRVTRADAQVEHLNTQVRQLSDTADTKSREAEKLRTDAEAARLVAARAEGELSAAKIQLDQLAQQAKAQREAEVSAAAASVPTTQPFGFLDALVPVVE